MLVLAGTSLLVVMAMLRQLNARQVSLRWAPALAIVLVASAAMTLASCGGGSNGGSSGALGTQAGNYTIAVTGSFSGGSANLSHATKLTLVVQ